VFIGGSWPGTRCLGRAWGWCSSFCSVGAG
jgi:hypothetical protein